MTTFKSTPEIAHGDMISSDMMRLLVDIPLDTRDGAVFYTPALIANAAWLRDRARRGNDHAAYILKLADRDGDQLRWTIQGNSYATWMVMSEFEVEQARAQEAEQIDAPLPDPCLVCGDRQPLTDGVCSTHCSRRRAQVLAARAIPAPPRRADRSDARQGFLRDVFVTALEGGVGYWSEATRYRHSDADTFQAVLVPTGEYDVDGVPAWGVWDDDDPRETAPLEVNADTIARGLGLYRRWASGEITFDGKPVEDAERRPQGNRMVVLADRTNWAEGDIDAGDADAILQFGVFGSLVFG